MYYQMSMIQHKTALKIETAILSNDMLFVCLKTQKYPIYNSPSIYSSIPILLYRSHVNRTLPTYTYWRRLRLLHLQSSSIGVRQ